MPKRIQMSRQKPWRADNPDAVIVSRPSKYGNPFKVGVATEVAWFERFSGDHAVWAVASITPKDNAEAVDFFRDWMNGVVDIPGRDRPDLTELAGRDLLCWCKLTDPCHADVELELANPDTKENDHV